MRGIRTAGVGLSMALTAIPALAQSPAATLGPIRVVETGAAPETTIRAQFAMPAPAMPAPRAPYRVTTQMPVQGQPMPMTGGPAVGQPQPIPNPQVTELRDQYGQPIPQYAPYTTTQGTLVPPPVLSAPGCDPATPGYGACPQPTLTSDPYLAGAMFPRWRSALGTLPNSNRLSISAEYLLWFVRAQEAPPLVTTSSPQFNGIIGTGDTQVIFGGQALNRTVHNGARIWANYWFPNNQWGIDGGVWFLGRNDTTYTFDSSSYPVLARPFVNLNQGRNFSEIIASPGLASGAAVINSQTNLWGSEANFRRSLIGDQCSRLDGLIGFKNMNLNESLTITETFTRAPGAPVGVGVPNFTSGTVTDKFQTQNNFYGVNLGLVGEMRRGRWFVNGRATVGLGEVFQAAQISGAQSLNTATGNVAATGGLYALNNANIGSYTEKHFGVMPEVGLNLGYYLTPHLRIGVGYNFLYLNSVIRPTGLIDQGLDVTKIPNFPVTPTPAPLTTNRPTAIPFQTTDFTAQGINFSLQWTW